MTYLLIETRLPLTLSLLTLVEILAYHPLSVGERGLEPPLHSIDKRLKAGAARNGAVETEEERCRRRKMVDFI
jgi:hypothetical protein